MRGSSGARSFSSPSGLDGAVTIVQVSGLHSDIMDEDLEAYFETPRSGGKRGSVVQCIFEEGGTACVEFNDPEGKYIQYEQLKILLSSISCIYFKYRTCLE